MTTSDYTIQAVKGISEQFNNAARADIEAYASLPMFDVTSKSENSEIFTSTEGFGGAKLLSQSETPPVANLQDGYSVTLSHERRGVGYIVNETMMVERADDTTKIDQYLMEQTDQARIDVVNLFVTDLHSMLNDAFVTTGRVAPDAAALCSTHTWNGGGTFNNSDTQALDEDAINTMETYAGAFQDQSGKPRPLDFKYVVVKKGSAAERQAIKLFASDIRPVAVSDVNIYIGQYTIVSTPYITAANAAYWFAFDPRFRSALHANITQPIGAREPQKEENESIRFNATTHYSYGISNMPFMIYGSDGTT